jgi:hypothetical protein
MDCIPRLSYFFDSFLRILNIILFQNSKQDIWNTQIAQPFLLVAAAVFTFVCLVELLVFYENTLVK